MVDIVKLRLAYRLILFDQLNIGSGAISLKGAHTSIALLGSKLPTTSFKGVLRKACNRIINLVNSRWKPCIGISPEAIMKNCNPGRDEYEWMKYLGVPSDQPEYYNTPLVFEEFKVVKPENPRETVYTYTHISIKASTQTVKKGSLYTVEYLPPGTIIDGGITILVETRGSKDRVRYGIQLRELPLLLKLILACLAETPYVGLGRQSKTFMIKLLNKEEILDILEKLGVVLDEETMNILEKLGSGINPYKR